MHDSTASSRDADDALHSLVPQVATRDATARQRAGLESLIPGWGPSAVLAGLVSFGFVGGLGLVPLPVGLLEPLEPAAAVEPPRVLDNTPMPTSSTSAGPLQNALAGEETVRVRHLVVSHKDSPLGKHRGITRTRDEAKQRASQALVRARKGEDFVKLVIEYSDEPGAAERKGDLGHFGRRWAIQPFSDKAFALKKGELSEVVETNFGQHVILRIE
jgi:hypothetical protein